MTIRMMSRRSPGALRHVRLSDRIERLRLARGWTQAELADRASISPMTVYRAETGYDVYAWVLAAIAEALETTMDELWRGEA